MQTEESHRAPKLAEQPLHLTNTHSFLRPLLATRGRELVTHGQQEVISLCDRRILVCLQSAESARSLVPIPLEGVDCLEHLLFESLIAGDEGLMLMTASDPQTSAMLGLIFWRDVSGQEMAEWLNSRMVDEHVVKQSQLLGTPRSQSHALQLPIAKHFAVQEHRTPDIATLSPEPEARIVTTDSWVKIELLGTDRSIRGHGLARLLLGMTLAYAVAVQHKTSAVLQAIYSHNHVVMRQSRGMKGGIRP